MIEKGYRTIGEMFAKDEKYILNKRNKIGEYNNCIERQELENEVKVLFEAQRKFGNSFTSKKFEDEYLQVFNYQKPFMTAELMEKMVGKCTFEKDEPRAAKNSWTFERFMLLQKINNLSYQIGDCKVYLTKDERDKIVKLAYEMKSGIKYTKIRKELNIPNDAVFTGLNYYYKSKKNDEKVPSTEEIKNKVEDSMFVVLKGYHEIKSVLEKSGHGNTFTKFLNEPKIIDNIVEVLTRNKTDITIIEELNSIGIETDVIELLLNISNFNKFGHLSYKAIDKILPYLEEGLQYDKAAQEAGYNFKADSKEPQYKLPVISKDEIRNPVVYRSVTQSRKVINAIINKYGSPYEIHIEVARELTKSFSERKKIEKIQNENRIQNDILKKDIEEHFGIKAKAVDILKLRLYREQQGKSAYSLMPIDYNRLFENGYVEIDHAVPFSRSFDDSYNNKVLVLSKENQEKRNMIPYEYFGVTDRWSEFEAFVRSAYRSNLRKRERLLVKNFNTDKENEWIARNLNDTKYIARFMSNFIKQNLLFENYGDNENRKSVKTINGAATSALRHYWGIPSKNRDENDLHHAEDAVIIACATEKFQNRIREYSKEKDLYYHNKNGEYVDSETGEIVDVKYKSHEMNRPWPEFKEELEARMSKNPAYDLTNGDFKNYNDIDTKNIKPIFVSRMPNRKIKGQAHEETIYSLKHKEKGFVTVKKPLNCISKSEIEMLVLKDECYDLYMSDKDLYDRIYKRLKEFDFKAEKAFGNDFVFRKYSKKGEGPIVRSIKVPSIMNSGVEVQQGLAANGNMVRVDVFSKDGKNYLVPIYVADMVKDKLPNKAIRAHKLENEWIEMDDSYEFKFSLYSNDLIGIKYNEKDDVEFYYYSATDRSSAGLVCFKHDKSLLDNGKKEQKIGVKNLATFDKYEVDVLGNYHKVKRENRKGSKSKLNRT